MTLDDELAKLRALVSDAPSGDIEWAPLTSKRSTHKPGTPEWFEETFGAMGATQMPLGFRGRKKAR